MNEIADYLMLALYAAPLLWLFSFFVRQKAAVETISVEVHEESLESGMTQPPSLHPVIDNAKCVGCESCVYACPEFPAHRVLGLVGRKATLVSPTDCIGHGACKTVCPVDAISLVFGTAERGVDIPEVNPDFSTNVPGVYIAGELGGMGLIRNAIAQGSQAIGSIVADLAVTRETHSKNRSDEQVEVQDVVIVGAGPAGMAATLGAMEAGLKHITIEQNALGGTVAQFPRGKLVMTAPAELPIVGLVSFTETLKEELVGFWQGVQEDTGMIVRCDERLLGVTRGEADYLTITTDKEALKSRSLLLAIGRRGTPRALGIPGEDLPKVTYSLIDAGQYTGQAVLVVGGGDSALEAACSLADEEGTTVTLVYRGDAFSRAKKKNRDRVEKCVSEQRLGVFLSTSPTAIFGDRVVCSQNGGEIEMANDAVIICAGGVLPNGLLQDIGVALETKYGAA